MAILNLLLEPSYNALSNLGVSLDYVVNNLTTDGVDGEACTRW